MQLTTAAAHIKSLSSSDLISRRSVAKTDTDCASSVNAVMHTPCCDGSMSVDSYRSDATEAITMMEVDPLRRRRDEEDMSLDDSTDDERFRREVCADSTSTKDGDSIGDVSMGDTVKGSIDSSGGLNGPYWADFELELARCEDVFGMSNNIPYRRITRSRLKMAADCSENSCDVSSMEDTQDAIEMEIEYEEDEDVQMGQGYVTRRIVDEDSDEEDSSDDDYGDEESVMSLSTTDGEGNLAFEGLDVQAINACAERMDEMKIAEDWTRMQVDDDDVSIAIARYHIKSTEVLDQHKSRVYFTRGLARLLLKRTRSGLCY